MNTPAPTCIPAPAAARRHPTVAPLPPLARSALDLAEREFFVFPLEPRGKRPITSNGFKAATRDPRAIADWWRRSPNANIGIACGASGIAVLDIDSKAGADPRQVLAKFDRAGAPVIGTGLAPAPSQRYPRSLAGRRGVQVYFRSSIPSAARLTINGCEIKARGGYVVASPSIHPCGVEYVGELPPVCELPTVPPWLMDLVRRPEPARLVNGSAGDPSRVLAGLAQVVRKAPVGNRNHATYWALHRVADHAHAGLLDVHRGVQAIRIAALEAGLPEEEIEQTIRSALALASSARTTRAAA